MQTNIMTAEKYKLENFTTRAASLPAWWHKLRLSA